MDTAENVKLYFKILDVSNKIYSEKNYEVSLLPCLASVDFKQFTT